MNEILNKIKDLDDAKETIGNLLEIINEMKDETPDQESTSLYQATSIGFIRS